MAKLHKDLSELLINLKAQVAKLIKILKNPTNV